MATLIIMAAGLGSRFSTPSQNEKGHGGAKQTTAIDEKGNCIIHYSILDAIKTGYTKIILIIRKKDQNKFDEIITNKFKDKINIEYAYQENDEYIKKELLPKDRIKPLGTTHALLSAKKKIKDECFALINADDFYGIDAFKMSMRIIQKHPDEYSMVTYRAKNVLSNQGFVKRGICTFKKGKTNVNEIIECKVKRDDTGDIIANPIDGSPTFKIDDDTPISMTFYILPTSSLYLFEQHFNKFINSNELDKMTCELILSNSVNYIKEKEKINLKSHICSSTWLGITYQEDLTHVKEEIKKLSKYYKEIL